MPITLKQLRSQLSAIEPDEGIYDGIGSAEIPLLEQLLRDEEAWLASRAVYALSRVPDIDAVRILSRAAADPRREVRVAVADSARNMKPDDASSILMRLLGDEELGVRKFAIRSVSGTHSAAVHARLRELETQDPASRIRSLAKSKLQEL
jgi:HEAT repeat protein